MLTDRQAHALASLLSASLPVPARDCDAGVLHTLRAHSKLTYSVAFSYPYRSTEPSDYALALACKPIDKRIKRTDRRRTEYASRLSKLYTGLRVTPLAIIHVNA